LPGAYWAGSRQRFFYFFSIIFLSGVFSLASGKDFILFFNNYFAGCPSRPGTRQIWKPEAGLFPALSGAMARAPGKAFIFLFFLFFYSVFTNII